MLVPHLIWLTNNDYATITYGLARTGLENSNLLDHITYPLIFLGKQIGILIPFFIMSFFLIKKFKYNLLLKDKKLLFLIFINLAPIGTNALNFNANRIKNTNNVDDTVLFILWSINCLYFSKTNKYKKTK